MDNKTKKEEAMEDKEFDPWALLDHKGTEVAWKDQTTGEKVKSVVKNLIFFILFLGFLYLFICSLSFLTNAFRLLGGKVAGQAFRESEILTNPVCDLMIGVLATVLLQSSSTVTSITVAMVASEVIPIRPAIFIVMGANIGTSVTNTIVALGQSMDGEQFRRAFAGATVHDMFNWLSVLVLLPVEWITGAFGPWKDCGFLCQITRSITNSIRDREATKRTEILHVITLPFVHRIIWIDPVALSKRIAEIASWNVTAQGPFPNATLMKKCYKTVQKAYLSTENETCALMYNDTKEQVNCGYLFEGVRDKWSDPVVGAVLLVFALVVLLTCLICMVKVLQTLMQGGIARLVKTFLNSNLPGRAGKFITGYLAIAIGAGTTMVIQSSSVFTSALTPLVGVGILHIKRMYPLTLGANLGTTLTACLAALALEENFANGLQIALCHFFFNLCGIAVWYPIPFMRKVPIALAKKLGEVTGKHRWFAGVYIALTFVIFPGGVFLLSLAGWQYLLGIAGPIAIVIIVIVFINVSQNKCPNRLPEALQDWLCCPKPLRSLSPYDKVCGICCICCKDKPSHDDDGHDFNEPEVIVMNGSSPDVNTLKEVESHKF